jgi:hypothetical protein
MGGTADALPEGAGVEAPQCYWTARALKINVPVSINFRQAD